MQRRKNASLRVLVGIDNEGDFRFRFRQSYFKVDLQMAKGLSKKKHTRNRSVAIEVSMS